MKTAFLYFFFLFVLFINSGCKKDEQKLTEMLYGKWITAKAGNGIFGWNDQHIYKFSRPNHCTYSFESADGYSTYTSGPLTFDIQGEELFIYSQNGNLYGNKSQTIQKLTPN
ncbi:MAG: hypothetical protein K2X86_02190 [Cytophagaceae bacterium]|nr:hypothetical protein [Cytophagaceae bacterium]